MKATIWYAGKKRMGPIGLQGVKWVYLGKDVGRRSALAIFLGGKERLVLGNQLHYMAERLRQPFLDFIGNLGRIQNDRLGWWASSCSWKSSAASDLFLLICYEHIVDELLEQFRGQHNRVLIIIEDPWLFCQLKQVYAGRSEVQFLGRVLLWRLYEKAILRAVLTRTVWAARLFRNYFMQRLFSLWKRRGNIAECDVAIFSYPQARSIEGGGGWIDPYFGRLDHLLKESGYSVYRFCPPHIGGLEQALAERSTYLEPLALYASPLCILKAMGFLWRPTWPTFSILCGMPIDRLLLRERWKDLSRASPSICKVFFECMKKVLAAARWKVLLYPYENQPWEKMLVLAARTYGVCSIGYQHGGGLARFMLSYFHGKNEAEILPLPDRIVTSGPYSHELFEKGGTPPGILVMGGSLRYQYLRASSTAASVPSASAHRILVALPIETDLVEHLLDALRKGFPDGGQAEGIEFAVKPHPFCRITLSKESLAWPSSIVSGAFEECIATCGSVLYTGTSTGLEALVMGRRVLRYRAELLLNTDRTEFLTGKDVINCSDHDLREKVLLAARGNPQHTVPQCTAEKLLRTVFAPVDRHVWLETVRLLHAGVQ